MSNLKLFTPFKYRDRVAIIGDILQSVRNSPRKERRKTQIMQSANLNYFQTKKYLTYLLDSGFLARTEKETYVMTEKGSRFLRLAEIERL